ncbi:MAG: hypothetical protein K1X44_08685 [Alphaproteobacteria bacterium]|nr:hypothetical protein [Alphaproteobacteria bacterium]
MNEYLQTLCKLQFHQDAMNDAWLYSKNLLSVISSEEIYRQFIDVEHYLELLMALQKISNLFKEVNKGFLEVINDH